MTEPTPVGFAGAHGVPPRRRRLRVLGQVVGVVLLVAGAGALVWGIRATVAAGRSLDDDAVARGRVAPLGGFGEPFGFVASGAEQFTVWIDTATSDEDARDAVVESAVCRVRTADGAVTELRGSRQDAQVTIGERSTVGTFTSAEGRVELRCTHEAHRSRAHRRRLGSERGALVVPGSPHAAGVAIVVLIGGVFAAVAGGILLGVSRRSR